MANKNVKEIRKVYNRKIARQRFKKGFKTNKISGYWAERKEIFKR